MITFLVLLPLRIIAGLFKLVLLLSFGCNSEKAESAWRHINVCGLNLDPCANGANGAKPFMRAQPVAPAAVDADAMERGP